MPEQIAVDRGRAADRIRSIFVALLVLAAPSSRLAAGDSPELLVAQSVSAAAPSSLTRFGAQAIRFNTEAAFSLAPGGEAAFTLPDGTRQRVVLDRTITHASGNRSWIGWTRDGGKDLRVVITAGPEAVYGQIATKAGEYQIVTSGGRQWLLAAPEETPEPSAPVASDLSIPPARTAPPSGVAPAIPELARPAVKPQAVGPSTIDVMVLYTPEFAAQHGGGTQALIDQLVAYANTVYADSQVSINLNLVHAQQINYGDGIPKGNVLQVMRFGLDPATAQIGELRNLHGADLVALVRPYHSSVDQQCGQAYLPWYYGDIASASYAFSVSDVLPDLDGGPKQCHIEIFTHELGHNLGLLHDRITDADLVTAGFYSAFPYAWGYGVANDFFSVMAYRASFGGSSAGRAGKFSSPNLSCNGQPCGVPAGQANAADNALALNNTREAVANFRPSGANRCAVSIAGQLATSVPLISFNGGSFWADFDYVPGTNGSHWFHLDSSGLVTQPANFSGCTPATVSPDLVLTIPSANYNGVDYWAQLQYAPEVAGGPWFYLSAIGTN